MIEELIREYAAAAKTAATVDYSDKKSVLRFNATSDRMRSIVKEVVAMGQEAVNRFTAVLEMEPAAGWAAPQLVELAELDMATLLRCFKRVELGKSEAESRGLFADAMMKEMWLQEWRSKKPL